MPENGDLRRNPHTGSREIFYDPPGTWEVLDIAVDPDHRAGEDVAPDGAAGDQVP